MNVAEAAKDLVTRSRLGDQIAMAGIVMVRERAQKGDPKASRAVEAIRSYIEAHPAGTQQEAGTLRESRSLLARLKQAFGHPRHYMHAVKTVLPRVRRPSTAAVALANGPNLLIQKPKAPVELIAQSFSAGNERDLFVFGCEHCKHTRTVHEVLAVAVPPHRTAISVGRIVGLARLIQVARLPNTPISPLSKMAGWELGE